MGIKMAPSESTKVALGVLALASLGLTLYILSRQLRKKKKTNEKTATRTTSVAQDASPSNSEKQSTPALPDKGKNPDTETLQALLKRADDLNDTLPQSMWDTHTAFGLQESASAAIDSKNEEDKKKKSVRVEQENGFDSSTAAETAPMFASLSSWEDVDPLSASLTEGKSKSDSGAGDMATSQFGHDSLSSFTPLGFNKESLNGADKQGSGGAVPDSGEPHSAALSGSNGQKESLTDNLMSLQSEDASSGALSFEQIDSVEETPSLAGVVGGGVQPSIHFQHPGLPQPTDSLQSFEQVDATSLSLHLEGNSNSMMSFEPISETDGAFEDIPAPSNDKAEEVATTQQTAKTQAAEIPHREESTDKFEEGGDPQVVKRRSTKSEGDRRSFVSEGDRYSMASEGDSAESSCSYDVVGRALGAVGGEQFYSSESLQSFATATSATSNMQDFYSPIASPTPADSSADNLSFQSFDGSSAETTSDEMTFYDLESSKTTTPPSSPLDRTPTNTPIINFTDATPEGDSQDFSEMLSSRMEESLIFDEATNGGKEEEEVGSSSSSTKDAAAHQKKTSAQVSPAREERPVLNIDKDKMAEAILRAQTSPERLEIGQLQILVELLKQDDWTLLNTAVQSVIRASAFTINVNILTVCEGPKELARLLDKFTALLLTRADPSSQGQGPGAPTVKTLFLTVARAVNNLAMDIKSQPQLESTIPVLTDLLMTEGISESVTLASLQPLTNLSAQGSKTYQGHYTRLLQQLYCFLDTSQSASLRLQCLKLLVNLSLNADMVPHMLAAKAPSCLLELLDVNYDVELLLRMVTFLANVTAIMTERALSASSLPPDEKAPSPETLYSALSALDRRDALRNKVYRLTRHDSEDVCYQASRLYRFVSSSN